MSFRCQNCGGQVPPKKEQIKIITKRRHKVYDDGGTGWEIVKELNVCDQCKTDLLKSVGVEV